MPPPLAHAAPSPATRAIPGDGRRLPALGLGTWQTFDVGADAAARANLGRLLARLGNRGQTTVSPSRQRRPLHDRAPPNTALQGPLRGKATPRPWP